MPYISEIWKKTVAIAHRYGFTKNETVIVLSLSAAMIGGTLIDVFRNSEPERRSEYKEEYQRHDSIFTCATQSAGGMDSLPSRTSILAQGRSKKELRLRQASININTADVNRLSLLPGIGRATADLIIRYRDTHGYFERIEDITRVKGIGAKKFDKMKPYIYLH